MCALKLFGANCPMRCYKIWRGPKKEGDVFQVRMSLYEIEPSVCYSVVAPNAIVKQARWNPNCVFCKSIGDGLYRTVLKF